MANIQRLLDESASHAQTALKSLFNQPGRTMTADEFRECFRSIRLFAMATTGSTSGPHIAPVHVQLTDDDEFEMTIQTESVRWKDVQRDPRVAFTGWAEDGKTVILYGNAAEIPDTRRESTAGGRSKPVLTLRIDPTRIHAMDPRRE
ncbi:MAG: pyridoxamine 5'-phosphate oxidase family protein [Chloroflexia bacterium]|nr:pyridoxamine 5'-phosphate oxidase family protein [Chloroflexia bacterium]